MPQQFIDVDRDKVIKQGVPVADVYRTIQAFMGGLFINYFNRFGRQWQVYIEAEGDYRTNAENVGQFYVRNQNGRMVPLSALTRFEPRPGPEFTMRYNLFRCAQINGSAAPGYSSNQATAALEQVFAQTMPSEMGLRLPGHFISGEKGTARCAAGGDLRTLAALRVSDPVGAVRELDTALQRSAEHASRGVWRFLSSVAAACAGRAPSIRLTWCRSRPTFTRKLDWSC